MNRELLVVDDIAAAAATIFLDLAPRTVVLAGGSTPQALYELLATRAYRWSETAVFFGDERCVPPDDLASNYRMAHEALLSKVEARVHRMRGESCDAVGYETELREVFGPGIPEFDVIFLGLGADGHTASLFPGDLAALAERERLVIEVERPDFRRLSLTLPLLSAAKRVVFLVAGAEKTWALRALMAGRDIPAAMVRAREVTVICDRAAAVELPARQVLN